MLRVARMYVCLVFRDAGRLSSVSEASRLETPTSQQQRLSASTHSALSSAKATTVARECM